MNEISLWSGILSVIMICLSICYLAILIVSSLKMSDSSHEFIIELGFNWSQGVITELFLSRNCSPRESFITDEWPGTVAGCQCIALSRGYCSRSRNSFQRYCIDVSPLPSIRYRLYDGMGICKKNTPDTYLELEISSGRCPNSHPQSCGRADTLEGVLCVKSSKSCPVNDIKFLKSTDTVPSEYKSLLLNKKRIIYTNTKTSGKLPILTKISDGPPCADAGEVNYYQGAAYILDFYYGKTRCLTTVANSIQDLAYQKLDTIYYFDLLQDNAITSALKQHKGYPNKRMNHDTHLYVRPYLG